MRIAGAAAAFLFLVHGRAAGQGAAELTLAAEPRQANPGSIVQLTLTGRADARSFEIVSGTLGGEPLHFRSDTGGRWHAIGPVPVDASGSAVARVVIDRAGRLDTVRTSISVTPLPATTGQPLAVDSQFTRPMDAATQARIASENERARAIGRRAHSTPVLWNEPFLLPRSSVITSQFGAGRLFNGRITSQHLGVDFRGAVGEPVLAANRGVVALVDGFFLAGNVVYIDHGGGIVTGYFHLSRATVATGDTVSRGQEIGRVGATGRVTGPHLHWSARYGAVTVNPMGLTALDPARHGRREQQW